MEGLYFPTPVTPEDAFKAIGRLRRAARDEINRLIQFLDKTDDYVSRELEENGDELDASYPDGTRLCSSPMEDDEDDDPAEDSDPGECSDTGIGDRDGLTEQFSGHGLFAGGVL
ncbi:hypothetical protein FNL55_15490 [Tardiphaga sp. vice352]|uniref:hypothetical protein n=1 Tax=unclassified Tardiphaga TaxID=2631404 RepID=UPI00116504B2|nr:MULTISPECIES: hypothetical protein [unclassified Tardiphaga]QDM17237.1 hypothetical protein FNL53_15780 [Tardiphaga sp. vice278]QDM22217.1 hypothetical protein FIU28_14425 [Tardiphaga sp. vice154]QDM32599.1 hypothetical protein FNL55_15490 [Tardiphaga sp. vice352]